MKDILILIVASLIAIAFAPLLVAGVKLASRDIAWNAAAATAPGAQRLLAYNAALADIARLAEVPEGDGRFVGGGRITGFNASLFDQSNFSEELTGYAVGFKDPNDIGATLEFVAPSTPSPRKPEYAVFTSAEEFLSTGVDDDLRAIGGDFPTVKYTSDKVTKKLLNRGLAVELDEDQIAEMPGWGQFYTAKLLRMLDRNSLRRAFALLSAASVNTAKTWSTAAGKNPDGDVRTELITAANITGIRPNRVLYGDTAWDTRVASHEAQDNAGGYAAAARTPEQVASFLNVEGVHVSRERFAATATATSVSEIVSTKVLMYFATANMGMEDPSNIKRFTGNVAAQNGGGKVAVHLRQVGDKRWRLAVEKYELTVITATLGIRQFTVAAA